MNQSDFGLALRSIGISGYNKSLKHTTLPLSWYLYFDKDIARPKPNGYNGSACLNVSTMRSTNSLLGRWSRERQQ